MRYSYIGNMPTEIKKYLKEDIYSPENPEYVFSFGGDGTMLKAVEKYLHLIDDVVFVGINTGKLGFYTDFVLEEFPLILEKLKTKKYKLNQYNLLCFKVNGKEKLKGYALNDLVVISPIKTINIDVYLNKEYFETFRGTGLVLSTPSGSTAYNKGLNGAVIEPTILCYQLTEIASINNNAFKTLSSSLVLKKDTRCLLKGSYEDILIIADGKEIKVENVESVEAKLSSKKIKLLVKDNHDFLHRVKKSFL
ncbi:MAG TPA: NAD kinase [Acholeplasma sp.]|nr:NAD kinase [Acholeplasma sp.]